MATALKYPAKFCLTDFIIHENIRAGRGNKIAIKEIGGETLTFARLGEHINKAANFVSQKLKPRDRALIILPDSLDFVSIFFGCVSAGIIPVVVNPLMNKAEIGYVLKQTKAAAIFTRRDFLPSLPRHEKIIVMEDATKEIAKASSKFSAQKIGRDEVAFIYYTSGTTGLQKGVAHKNVCLPFCADTYSKEVAGLRADDVVYSSSKLSFIYSLVNALYSPLRHGATVILNAERSNAVKAFDIIRENKVTAFVSVPAFYNAMLDADGAAKVDLSPVRLCISAGEALPPKIFEAWKEKFGLEILDGVGTTETAGIFISNRAGRAVPGSLGTPVAGYEVKIVDEDFKKVGDGQIGYMLIGGGSLTAGYWGNDALTNKVIFEKSGGCWFKTGDMIRRDKKGVYWFCGRADDVIKQAGIPVSSTEIETALGEHPKVQEVAVTKSTEGDGLEKAKAFVVLKPGVAATDETKEELKEFVKVRLAPYKRPKIVEFVESLPRTSVGKIYRKKLRETQ